MQADECACGAGSFEVPATGISFSCLAHPLRGNDHLIPQDEIQKDPKSPLASYTIHCECLWLSVGYPDTIKPINSLESSS